MYFLFQDQTFSHMSNSDQKQTKKKELEGEKGDRRKGENGEDNIEEEGV